ncbi:NAD(P)/FAD-dependent oxidoreductase [Nocardia sp. CDC159]|uniref:NAD(P)/FAD-dependent oxidoreductase n=1 Tax=Nocardia pulmonis TaxID=2951408 RepID=A0A9X2EEP0_9NOCA|nr:MULTISPECIES: NAD(P)/FAD-dependent oxidoreductase [Nocardia]MCM6777603.1 NAD(P)/FAD-dependent oxidoreductase [Nocardia pulmonis]MCM6790593.1 NAD(P)/FAD-dependent oxidoreductase [Nocardia sp. CDC159]
MSTGDRDVRVIVIGAGVAGIATAYTIKQAGFTNLTVLEKGSDVGGVWHWNRYPGLTCDVPAQIYQFSFAPKPDWTHIFASGEDIRRYHRDVVERFGLDARLRLDTEVTALDYDEVGSCWTVTTADGEKMAADFVICATGVLHHPFVPDIPGMDTFEGPIVHTARWHHDLPTAGRRIAVIGAGSTGVQVVSALQPDAETVVHFARSPQWILWAPIGARQWSALTAVLRRRPAWHDLLYRRLLRASDILADITTTPSWRRSLVQWYARTSLRIQVRDPKLRAALTPDYQPLCKRQVVSGNYYRAISASNARLVTDPIDAFTARGVRTVTGEHHDVDLVVLATGFHAHNYMRPMSITGRDGTTLDDVWAKGPRAYRMTAIPGFPNLFTVLGPNPTTGSISQQYTAELTARYIVGWLERFRNHEFDEVEVTQQATDDFNTAVADALGPTVWNTGCHSWYFSENGTIDLWPFDRSTLTRLLTAPDPADYHIR